mgnify:CR=1 FL=1
MSNYQMILDIFWYIFLFIEIAFFISFTSDSYILIVCFSIAVALVSYLLLGWILGENVGQFSQNLKSIFFEILWSFALSPLLLPLIFKLNRYAQSNLERV